MQRDTDAVGDEGVDSDAEETGGGWQGAGRVGGKLGVSESDGASLTLGAEELSSRFPEALPGKDNGLAIPHFSSNDKGDERADQVRDQGFG